MARAWPMERRRSATRSCTAWEAQQPDQVRDRGAVLAGARRDLLVTQIHFRVEPIEGLGGLHRVQVFALDILDQRDFQDPVVRIILDDGRNFDQSGQFSRPKASLSGDKFIVRPAGAPSAVVLSRLFL